MEAKIEQEVQPFGAQSALAMRIDVDMTKINNSAERAFSNIQDTNRNSTSERRRRPGSHPGLRLYANFIDGGCKSVRLLSNYD